MSDNTLTESKDKITGKLLNERWQVNARHALYHEDGRWYHYLRHFPGVLFDSEGYVVFSNEEDYRNSNDLQFGEHVNIPNGIASMPSYVHVGAETTDDEATDDDTGSIYPYETPDELDIRPENHPIDSWIRKLTNEQIITNPEFQRRLVWHNRQKCLFIESILLNIPLPPIYVNQDHEGNYILVDGLQRTTAIAEFIRDSRFRLSGLNVLHQLNDKGFADLPPRLRRRLEDRQLLIYIIKPSVPTNMVYDIFHRINTGGTQLVRQEIRNCLFIGKATRLLKSIADNDLFKQATGWGISPLRMKDQEAVLRCVAFSILDYRSDYRGDMDLFLGEAMKYINRSDDDHAASLEVDFLRVLHHAVQIFGTSGFRLSTTTTKGRLNIAVMESVLFALSNLTSEEITTKSSQIEMKYRELISDTAYLQAVRYSTGDTRKVITRFEMARDFLRSSQ